MTIDAEALIALLRAAVALNVSREFRQAGSIGLPRKRSIAGDVAQPPGSVSLSAVEVSGLSKLMSADRMETAAATLRFTEW